MRTLSNKPQPIARFVVSLILIPVLAPFVLVGWAFWRDNRLTRGFDKITDGATRQDVVRLMGTPKKVEKCGDFLAPVPQSEINLCASEYLYAATFAPYTPQYYIVRFDGSGQVISKIPLSSP